MGKCILIIDDEVDIATVVGIRLEARGYEVLTAVNGKEAIVAAQTRPLDLIVMDYRLPDMGALDLARKFRENKNTEKAPIILITASIERIAEKAAECGASGYISKPIEPEELYAQVGRLIGNA